MIVNVLTCTLRRDDQYLITFKVGGAVQSALSATPIKAGTDARVRDGKVVS